MVNENRVQMSVFTYFLDESIQNAFTVLKSIEVPVEVEVKMRELKRRIAS